MYAIKRFKGRKFFYLHLVNSHIIYHFMKKQWVQEYEKVYTGVRKERVWELWKDVDNWPKWHGDLESCRMVGDFMVGSHFYLKPKGMRAVKIVLTEVEEGRGFTDCTAFLGAKMYDTHEVEEIKDGVRLRNRLVVTGPLRWLWVKLVARNVAKSVPEEMEALVNLAKEER